MAMHSWSQCLAKVGQESDSSPIVSVLQKMHDDDERNQGVGETMTERQWLTSTGPAAMWEFVRDRVTNEHREYVTKAFQEASLHADWYEMRADILRDIVPYRELGYIEDGVLWLDRGYTKDHNHSHVWEPVDWLQWQDGAIPKMVDAMMNEECGKCAGHLWYRETDHPKWLARCACGTGRIPRTEPRWADMLVIADALEEAGCSEPAILEHLRSERDGERCPWCEGADLGKLGAANCDKCRGTGRIKRRHWCGCHILELLSRQPSGTGERD